MGKDQHHNDVRGIISPIRFEEQSYIKLAELGDLIPDETISTLIRRAITEWIDQGENRELTGLGTKINGGKNVSVRLPGYLLEELSGLEDGEFSKSELARCAVRWWLRINYESIKEHTIAIDGGSK